MIKLFHFLYLLQDKSLEKYIYQGDDCQTYINIIVDKKLIPIVILYQQRGRWAK